MIFGSIFYAFLPNFCTCKWAFFKSKVCSDPGLALPMARHGPLASANGMARSAGFHSRNYAPWYIIVAVAYYSISLNSFLKLFLSSFEDSKPVLFQNLNFYRQNFPHQTHKFTWEQIFNNQKLGNMYLISVPHLIAQVKENCI